MHYRILADMVVLIHLAFVAFAVLGALLVFWRRYIIWLHLPAVGWSVWIEFSGNICPLTPLENWLRVRAGQGGYRGDFVENYLESMLYPAGLTPERQILLAALVVFINLAIYGYGLFRLRPKKR